MNSHTTPESSKSSGDRAEVHPARTPLYECHVQSGAKLVDFAGWEMPVSYGSQMEEHRSVRQHAGMFDVSHMTVIDISGENAHAFLSVLLANDIDKTADVGKALYTCMLNERGGVIDDLIVYHTGDSTYRMVVNASTREKNLAWLQQHQPDRTQLQERTDLALIAVQGPSAVNTLVKTLDPAWSQQLLETRRFYASEFNDWFFARTGYTGEDGFEIALPSSAAIELWQNLLASGVIPCGLGARDTLRLEAGLNLYGNDMDESVTPLDCGLAWTIAWEPESRNFIGRQALQQQQIEGTSSIFTGLILQDRGVLRQGQEVYSDGKLIGVVTSGTFSPTLEKSIGLARLQIDAEDCSVKVRDKYLNVKRVRPPFVQPKPI